MTYKQGLSVTCKINDVEITDAKMTFEDGDWCICQDKQDGQDVKNKLGYKHSWWIRNSSDEKLILHGVTDLKEAGDRIVTWENLAEGDTVLYDGKEVKILAVCGELFGISWQDAKDEFDSFYTIKELKEYHTLPVPIKPMEEITLAEAEKLLGKKIK